MPPEALFEHGFTFEYFNASFKHGAIGDEGMKFSILPARADISFLKLPDQAFIQIFPDKIFTEEVCFATDHDCLKTQVDKLLHDLQGREAP